MKYLNLRLTALMVMGLATCGWAREDDHNANLWMNYFGDHPLSENWQFHLDTQIRRDNVGLNRQQRLVQPGFNWKVSPKLTLGAGYGYMRTYPYGEYPIAAPVSEQRVWEQASTTTPLFGLEWNHRLRLEQRRLGQLPPNPAFRHENRIRYRLLTTIALPFGEQDGWYLKAFDEIFLNFGGAVARNQFDQNRAYLGLGRRLARRTKLEFGFMEQSLQHRNGRVMEHNHTLMFSIISGWPFRRE